MPIIVGHYLDPAGTHIVRGRLLAEGIPAFVAGDRHVTANWPIGIALGGVRVPVPEALHGEAPDALQAYEPGRFAAGLDGQPADPAQACPRCGFGRVHARVPASLRLLAVASSLLAAAPFPTRASRMVCAGCGYHWNH